MGNYEILIYSLDGKRIYNERKFAPKGIMNVIPMQSAKIYIVRLIQDKRIITKKYQICK